VTTTNPTTHHDEIRHRARVHHGTPATVSDTDERVSKILAAT